jgi:hypothetical protein
MMVSKAVGISCTQRWGAADTLVTIKGEGGGARSDGHSWLQSEAVARRVQKRGRAWPVTNGGMRRCTILKSGDGRHRLALEVGI